MRYTALLLIVACAACAHEGTKTTASAAPASWVNDLTPIGPADWNAARAAHLLNRAGFGGTPDEVRALAAKTPQQAVDSLVDFETIDASALPAFEESPVYPHGFKFMELQNAIPIALATGKALGVPARREGKLPLQPGIDEFYTLLISDYAEMNRAGQWWADRMLRTPRPLQEKLALFWHGHFATSQEKVHRHRLMLRQIQTFRELGAGNFRALLTAVAQDPAMLIWLDNRSNVKGKPNENFAREIMELFSMGEGKGYAERDIREMARAFTGWTMTPDDTADREPRFVDDPKLHDDGEKTFLGATGKFRGHDAIDLILKQPAPPRFITRKLYRFFVRPDLAPELHEKLAALLTASNYELKPLLKTIFLSHDFYSDATVGAQIKSPVQLIVSTYRKMGLRELPGIPDFTQLSGNLGQTLFFPPNVAGWPGEQAWINPATLLTRGNFIHTLLFPPSPEEYGAPDKVVSEGYRRIPISFPQYEIQPKIWSFKTQKMEPVSVKEYADFLARIEGGDAEGQMAKYRTPTAPAPGDEAMMVSEGGPVKSRLGRIAAGEQFNLAVGLFTGFMQAYDRVRPIPRTAAKLDFATSAREAGAATCEEAVDAFARRFLTVPLSPERRAAVIGHLKNELASNRIDFADPQTEPALRQTVYLILCAPEYQLN